MTGWSNLRGPVLFAHRGHHVRWPENSLEAFRAAADLGADALELDVHLTRDGHVVVCHDPDGTRVAGEPASIAQCTLRDVEHWSLRGAATGDRVRLPTLDAVLAELPDALLNVDLKSTAPDLVDQTLDVLARHDAADRVLLTSFSTTTLARVRRAGYAGPTGLARREAAQAAWLPRILARVFPPRGRRLQIPTRYGPFRLDTPSFIARAHGRGLAVDYWVVDDPTEAEALLAAGADGIVTDDLAAMVTLFEQSPHGAAWRARHRAA